jgi:hypothetical protein
MARTTMPRARDIKTAGQPIRLRRTDWLGLAALLAAGCLILALSWFKLGSLDTGYHLAYGRHFLDSGQVVGRLADPSLYPETAVPFVNANWGSQVIMAGAEWAAGAQGLIALRIFLIAIIHTCIAIILRRQGLGWHWVAWAWLLTGITAYERFSMRPELFGYAMMLVMLVLLVRGLRSWRTVVALVALQLAWVNLHSYFLIGIFLTAACLLGESIVSLLVRFAVMPRSQTGRRTRLLALVLALQAGACLVNPRCYRGATFPLTTLGFLHGEDVMGGAAGDASSSAWSHISEFQSPFSFFGQDINARTIHAYCTLLAIAAIGLIALLLSGQFGPALVLVMFFAMSTQMRRNIAPFAFVATPLALGAIAAAFPWSALDRTLRRVVRSVLLAGTIGLAGWWIVGIASGRFYYVERRITRQFGSGYSERTFQRDAVRWLAAQADLQPRLFVDYFSSSNTLPWLPAKFRLFVNTNTFAYQDDTLQAAFKLGLGQTDHRGFFQQYGINVVLLHCGPDTQMLVGNMVADDGEWAVVYFDRHSVIFVRRIMPHVPVIRANRLSEEDLNPEEWIAALTGPAASQALALGTMVNVPMSLGWSRPASVLLAEALKLAPDYYQGWHYLGVCHGNLANQAARQRRFSEAKQQYLAAIDCFQQVLALQPDHPPAAAYLHNTKVALQLLPDQ